MTKGILQILASVQPSTADGSFSVAGIEGHGAYMVGRNSRGEAALLINATGTGRTVPIRLAGIEAIYAMPCMIKEVGRPGRTQQLTAITCLSRDQAVEAYFASVIVMLIDLLGPLPETTAVSGAVDHLIIFFQKLRLPPRKSIVGLVGELLVIATARDPGVAVEAWRRDPDERYDFAVGNLRLEAKATSTRNRTHEISYEQVTPPEGTVGLLASMFVERSGGGTTLRDLLSSIETRLPSHEAILRLRTIVADTLGQDLVTSMGWSFDLQHGIASADLFDLRTIPAIRGPLPAEVSGVRFTANLSRAKRVGARTLAGVAAESRGLLPG